ncbi:MAG: GNVR domain-containing protein, partial [bacterium]
DTTIGRLRSQLSDLEVSRQQAMLWATTDNPEIMILDSEIEAVRKELYREYANYYDAEVANLMVESASYQAQLDVSQGILDELDKKIEEFPPQERYLVELSRDRDVFESIYYVVTQELEQARIQELREETPFTVLDEAIVPNKPILPRKLVIILGTFALSFWIGVFTIFATDAFRRSKEIILAR